ncbi:MAG: hypothetical protein ACRCZE_04055 [Candidatus Altimarinota bacterium]
MSKSLLIALLSSTLLLAACSTTPAPADNQKVNDSKVTVGGITVQGPVDVENITKSNGPTTPDQSSNTPMLTNKKGIIITEKGFAPSNLTATVGQELLVYNATEAQVDLYTTSDGQNECSQLGSTFVLAAKETKYFKLDEAFSCVIIDQMKSDQSVQLTVVAK